MVTRGHGRDRGQLILIGAITIAFILLGIVLVFNGVVYTETASTSSTSSSASDAKVVEYELEDGIQGVATSELRIDDTEFVDLIREQQDAGGNVEDLFNDEEQWEAEIEDFSNLYQSASTASQTNFVSLELEDVSDENALEINTGSTVENADDIFDGSDSMYGNVLYFTIYGPPEGNFDDTLVIERRGAEDPIEVHIDADGGTGEEMNITVTEGANVEECTVDDKEGTFDFVTGEVIGTDGDCGDEIDVIDPEEQYDLISLDPQTNLNYDIIGFGETSEGEEVPGVITISYSYGSSDVSTTRSIEVDLYGDLL